MGKYESHDTHSNRLAALSMGNTLCKSKLSATLNNGK